MKTRFSQIAAVTFFGLFILFANVSADGKEKSALKYDNIEEVLLIENWMVNDNFWEKGETLSEETATEESLELETWMINDKVWNVENDIPEETEKEETLELGSWMTDENIWNK